MKSKNFKVAVFILFVAIICIGIFWRTQSSATAPEKTAQTSVPAKFDATKLVIPPPQAAKTLAPPNQPKPEITITTPAADTPTVTDPRANPDTCLAEGIHLLESKDFVTFLKEYRPPERFYNSSSGQTYDQIIEQAAQKLQNDPSEVIEVQNSLARMQAVQGTTPVMSHGGDTATYTAPDGLQIVMMRIDGHWIFAQW